MLEQSHQICQNSKFKISCKCKIRGQDHFNIGFKFLFMNRFSKFFRYFLRLLEMDDNIIFVCGCFSTRRY